MGRDFDPADSGYVDVAARIVEFRTKYPDSCLQPVDPSDPFKVVTIGEQTFIAYTAAAYRTPDDTRPGIGAAWEPFPGRTPYTRNSELMNAETSAWGRAIIAVGAADSKKGVASAEEVRNRQAERDAPPEDAPAQRPEPQTDPEWLERMENDIAAASSPQELETVANTIKAADQAGQVAVVHGRHLFHLYQQKQGELNGQAAA
jgi:hypothetical protein